MSSFHFVQKKLRFYMLGGHKNIKTKIYLHTNNQYFLSHFFQPILIFLHQVKENHPQFITVLRTIQSQHRLQLKTYFFFNVFININKTVKYRKILTSPLHFKCHFTQDSTLTFRLRDKKLFPVFWKRAILIDFKKFANTFNQISP